MSMETLEIEIEILPTFWHFALSFLGVVRTPRFIPKGVNLQILYCVNITFKLLVQWAIASNWLGALADLIMARLAAKPLSLF